MTKAKVDAIALRDALDQARASSGKSWRQLAFDIGVTPSLLSRLRNGYKPDADGFMTLVGWLGLPAEAFLTSTALQARQQPELAVELAPILRSREYLSQADIEMLQDVIQAALRHVAAKRGDDLEHRSDGVGERASA